MIDNGDGTYSFKMLVGKVTVTATFMDDNAELPFFVDVPVESHYYAGPLRTASPAAWTIPASARTGPAPAPGS